MVFGLRELVDRYVMKLSGMAYSRKYKSNLPVYLVYKDVMAILDLDNDGAKKYKEKIIGKTCLEKAPQEYWDIGAIMRTKISFNHWQQIDVHDRAKILARMYIEDMISVIDRHYEEQDSALKRATDGKTKS